MKLSVVIPLYNKEMYIRRAIESVLAQTSPADEILVVDDGSTDDSALIVRGMNDARVRLIQQPNGGECVARNRGIADARNDWVAFLDADDEWEPGFLAGIQRLAIEFPGCGIYATAFKMVQPDGRFYAPPSGSIPPEPWRGVLPAFFRTIQTTMPFYPSSVVASRQACLDLGGFPPGVKRGGDIIMWIRLGLRYPIAYDTQRLAVYHTEALNRACDVFLSEQESICAREISAMLDAHLVPGNVAEDLREYRDLLNIRKAKEILLYGNAVGARTLLKKAAKTRAHRREWLWWFFWSGQLASSILPLIRRMYASLR